MKKMLNEGNQVQNFISSPGSRTVINYGSGSGLYLISNTFYYVNWRPLPAVMLSESMQ